MVVLTAPNARILKPASAASKQPEIGPSNQGNGSEARSKAHTPSSETTKGKP
jgi:hypothetical protein